jgi:hypothetical protein
MRVQGNRTILYGVGVVGAINWIYSLLEEGSRPKNGKSRLNLHGTISEEKSMELNQFFLFPQFCDVAQVMIIHKMI